MRMASALQYVEDEILLVNGAHEQWKAARLPEAIEEIASSLASLELEGFNVSIPPSSHAAMR